MNIKLHTRGILILAVLLLSATAAAVPAYRVPRKVMQPDGSSVTVVQNGDEYLNFITTTDGYTVLRDTLGFLVYANRQADGSLTASSIVAHDAADRSAAETAFLEGKPTMLAPAISPRMVQEQQAENTRRRRALLMRRAAQYDYTKFRGLVILVEYNDRSFHSKKMASIIDDMVNKENYKGDSYTNITGAGLNIRCYGSVHDYFRDNSNGLFRPKFDIVGPVKVNRSQYYAKQTDNSNELMKAVLKAANDIIDFSDYDTDGDGTVDMVYFLFAGGGSHDPSNDQRLLWPHAGYLYDTYDQRTGIKPLVMDGVTLGRFACGVELLGSADYTVLDGIGTMCHEFSHVLGLPDFYDTDSEKSGGIGKSPGDWSLMSGGNYNNYSRQPCGYSLYERYSLGFCPEPAVLNTDSIYTLHELSTTNEGYRIDTPTKNEFFLLENRQRTGWDKYLPGHGMLVYRVDRSQLSYWNNNEVNNNPHHLCYELLFAGGATGQDYYGSASDPFPGTNGVTVLGNNTTPAHLKTRLGRKCAWVIEDIAEAQGIICFNLMDAKVLKAIALPESLDLWVGTGSHLVPGRKPAEASYYYSWSSDNTEVADVDTEGNVTAVGEGSATITVTANDSITATCTVTVRQPRTANTIAEFRVLPADTDHQLQLTDAQVFFVHNDNYYVRDATGTIVLTGSFTFTPGDMLSGNLFGHCVTKDRMPYLELFTGGTYTTTLSARQGDTPVPDDVSLHSLTAGNIGDYVRLREVTIGTEVLSNRKKHTVARDGEHAILLTNAFGIDSPLPADINGSADQLFDVEGIYTVSPIGLTFYDELLLTAPVSPSQQAGIYSFEKEQKGRTVIDGNVLRLSGFTPSAPVTVFRPDGRRIAAARTAADGSLVLPLPTAPSASGICLVRVGNHTCKVMSLKHSHP